MFDNSFEDRLVAWRKFRDGLEISTTPLGDVVCLYSTAPLVSIHIDPWDQTTWPMPWQLLKENQYCDFCIVLGCCYSLQLTDRFKASSFEIHIGMDYANSQTYYLLFVDSNVIGYEPNTVTVKSKLPETLVPQRIYVMPSLH
jgi:hypothetical protein